MELKNLEPKRKLQEYLTKGVRRIKHRKGFGVHSPFAYSIITEVIEEKCPYYAYGSMKRAYGKGAPVPFKVASLLFRLANRFQCRRILVCGNDGGYTLLPLLLVDSRNVVTTVGATPDDLSVYVRMRLSQAHIGRIDHVMTLADLPADYRADMIIVNGSPADKTHDEMFRQLRTHATERTVFFFRGVKPGGKQETLWDQFCDCDDISITMDLYDYGLAICRPHFFKQHYIVAF